MTAIPASLKRLWGGLRYGWSEAKPEPRTTYRPVTGNVVALQTAIDQIMARVDIMASGRTRYEGSPIPADEQLAAEVRRLRAENADLRAELENANGY